MKKIILGLALFSSVSAFAETKIACRFTSNMFDNSVAEINDAPSNKKLTSDDGKVVALIEKGLITVPTDTYRIEITLADPNDLENPQKYYATVDGDVTDNTLSIHTLVNGNHYSVRCMKP